MRTSRVLIFAVSLGIAVPAAAQSVPSQEPSSTHIFPAGGRRGTVVPVRVGSEALPPGANFRLWGDGVSAPQRLTERAKARYEPSPRRPPRDADGVGAAMSYSTEWQSQIEIAGDAPLGPKQWRLSCGWGGTRVRPFLVGDLPEFIETEPNSTADRAERVTLPATINGQIAGERDIDCFVFTASAGDTIVADVLAARIGSPLDPVVELFGTDGRRVPTETSRVAGDNVLTFHVPADGDYVLQIANVSFRGGPEFVYRITLSDRPAKPVTFPPGDSVEPDDNHSAATAMELVPPATVHGRFLTVAEEDWFRFRADKDAAFTITCNPFSATSAAMPVLVIEDAAGRTLAKASSAESADRECLIEWRAPAAGEYRLRLRDLQHGVRGGLEFAYRLAVRPAEPDFTLAAGDDYLNVTQGSRAELDLTIKRRGGFAGPIELAVTGLPDGVSFEPARVAENQSTLKLALKAIDDTRPTDATLRISGKATVGDRTLERVAAVSHIGVEATGTAVPASIANTVQLTVQHKPIFRLTCSEAYQYAHRGTVYPYAMQIERLGGFDGEIHVQLCERQVQDLDGIEVVETVIPPGVSEFKNRVYLPETMHVSVQHHCRPYAQAWATFTDKWGQPQSMLAISDKRCMIRTMPTVVKLKALDDALTARPGEPIVCQLMLDRTANFSGDVDIELLEPDAGFAADRVRIGPGETRAEVAVRVSSGPHRSSDVSFKFRAVGKLRDDVLVISEAVLPVRIEN